MGNITENNVEQSLPVPLIGQVKFFDYTKKHFGLVWKILPALLKDTDTVYIREEDLQPKGLLKENKYVFFYLQKRERGFYGDC